MCTSVNSWSIRRKLLFLLLVILLPSAGGLAKTNLEERRQEIGAAKSNALMLAQSLAAQQEQIAIGIRQMLSTLANLPEIQRLDTEACNKIFHELHSQNPFYSNIAATTPDGNVFAASVPFTGTINLSDRKHIRETIETLRFSAGEYILGRVNKVQSINYSYPVLDAEKKLIAIVIAGFKLDEYAHFMTRAKLTEDYTVAITDHRGVRLFRFPEHEATNVGKPIPRDSLDAMSGRLEQGIFERAGEDGVDRIYAFKQLRLRDDSPPYLYMAVGMAKEQILRQADFHMALDAGVLSLSALIAVSVAWIFGNLAFLRPIKQLVSATQRFGKGELGARTNLPYTPDELGQLAKSFDDMASLLEKRDAERRNAEEALEKVNAELEEKVRERTADLEQSNALLAQEITERKRVEEAVRNSEERYRQLFNSGNDAVFVHLGPSGGIPGRIVEVNDIACKRLGYSREELLEMSPLDIDAPDALPDMDWVMKELAAKGHAMWEGVQVARDGKRIPVEINNHLFNLQGMPIILATARDITERKQAEEERVRVEALLRQSQKMEALGTLAGGIAHDFNNILGIILGYTEMAQWDAGKESPVRKDLQEVLKAAKRAKDLVRKILAFSRRNEQEKKPVQVGLIVKEALKILRASIPSTIEIKMNVVTSAVVLADLTQIHQVLMNLCTNAAHAMEEKGGVLDLSLTDVHLESEDTLSSSDLDLRPGAYMKLTVRDTGHGIDPAILDRIFDPFFTTEGPGAGTGLGLSVVHGIVKSHGGAVKVESSPGGGTAFEVFFPVIENAPAVEAVQIAPLLRGREHILLVDDEPALAMVTKQMLERLGYEVDYRTNGVEALETFRRRTKETAFDLVITDMTMPLLTGAQLARELLRLRPSLPIILCTGFSEKMNEQQAQELGIQGFLMKPIVVKELAGTIRRVLKKE